MILCSICLRAAIIVDSIDPVGGLGVDLSTAESQDAQARASAAEFVGEGEDVRGASPEPVQRCDDEEVPIDQGRVRNRVGLVRPALSTLHEQTWRPVSYLTVGTAIHSEGCET